jgi:hypothetical protein
MAIAGELRFATRTHFGCRDMSIADRKRRGACPLIKVAFTSALICGSIYANAQAGPPPDKRVATLVFGGAYNGARVVPHRTILGEVKDTDGKPVDGAMVYLRDVNDASLRVQRADEKGAYHFGPLSLSHDFELWAEIKDRKTPKKPVSSFLTTNEIIMPLRFVTVPTPQTAGSPH